MLLGQYGERDDDVGISMDEVLVEVAESKAGLNILNLSRFRPAKDGFDFIFGHPEPIKEENESQAFHAVFVEFAFLWGSIEPIFLESLKNFLDVTLMLTDVIGVD
ncbi:hypothetical protein L208DRAFT_1293064 [Tricholoma matsutake]|nr:hypothetical protein L208DRAFT_1293064 [Tricholoma matsutake 945]